MLKSLFPSKFEWMIAFGYLRAQRTESMVSLTSVISFLGIMLGVAALIIVMAVMNGFRTELLDKILGVNGHLFVTQEPGKFIGDTAALANKIRKLPNVRYVTPVLERKALILGGGEASGISIRGLTKENIRRVPKISEKIVEGSLENFNEGIVIGKRLGRRLGVEVGDEITLLSPQGVETPFGMLPRSRLIKVVAFFQVGNADIDGGLGFLPLKVSQEFLSGTISEIQVGLHNPDDPGPVARQIFDLTKGSAYLQSWRHRYGTLASALEVERNVMFIILTMIIMIAALNIISGMVFLVKEKTGEIAMLRAMGVSRNSMMRIFFIAGSLIGVLGTGAGFLLGWVFCENIEEIRQFLSAVSGTEIFPADIYFLSRLPAIMDTGETLSAVLMALALSFAATIYPALRAANVYPAEALRYE